MRTRFVPIAVATVLLCSPLAAQKLHYPETKRLDHTDTYFSVQVADPYRWLEDESAAETAKWVESENRVTFGYLEKIPYRESVKVRLEKLFDYPKYGEPFRNGEYFFFSKNDGLQNQSVYYMQKGLEGTPEVLLDPNTFSADGTSPSGRVRTFEGRQISRLWNFNRRIGLERTARDGGRFEADDLATC